MQKAFSALFIILFFFTLIFCIHYGIYHILVGQGSLKLKDIHVTGNEVVSSEKVIDSSGLRVGEGIFDFSLTEAAVCIETNRFVESAQVRRMPPNGVLIKVVERKPVGVLTDKKHYYICDKNGYIITEGILDSIPSIVVDYNISSRDNQVEDDFIGSVLENLSAFSGLDKIQKIYVRKKEGVYFTLRDLKNTLFFIGKMIPDSEILNKLMGIAGEIKKNNINVKYIDINKENAIGFK
jgi:cell division septal protein FtsQ